MGKTIYKIGRREREVEDIEIFDIKYPTLTEKDRENALVANRAKRLARKYKDLNLKDLDEDNLTDEQVEEIQTLINDLVVTVLPTLKKAVLVELTDVEKMQILQLYFNSANGRSLLSAAGAPDLPPTFNGEILIDRPSLNQEKVTDFRTFGTEDEAGWPDPAAVGGM